MLAVLAGAFDIKRQVVLTDHESMLLGHRLLPRLDLGIVKLFNAAALHADHVIMMFARIEFEDRLVVIEVMPEQQPGLFKLHENAINRGQTHIVVLGRQDPIDIIGRKMVTLTGLKQFQNALARRGYL